MIIQYIQSGALHRLSCQPGGPAWVPGPKRWLLPLYLLCLHQQLVVLLVDAADAHEQGLLAAHQQLLSHRPPCVETPQVLHQALLLFGVLEPPLPLLHQLVDEASPTAVDDCLPVRPAAHVSVVVLKLARAHLAVIVVGSWRPRLLLDALLLYLVLERPQHLVLVASVLVPLIGGTEARHVTEPVEVCKVGWHAGLFVAVEVTEGERDLVLEEGLVARERAEAEHMALTAGGFGPLRVVGPH